MTFKTSAAIGSPRERWHQPIRLTALYREHLALGASMQERAGWLLPISYADRAGELDAVRRHAGLLDIGETGKIDVKAHDLEAVLSDMLPGSTPVDVGKTTSIDGHITILRLTLEQALLLTRPEDLGGALDRIRGVAGARPCAHVVDITGALCGVRLLGPQATSVLERISALDLAPAAFSQGAVVQGAIAKIHAIITRRDAVGFPGYDIYVDRDLGSYLWDMMLEVGSPLGLRPVGRAIDEELR